jgi:TRAP-type C4-dicarboxylate transport system permease small subunit
MPIKKLNDWIGKIEGYLLTLILVFMIGLAFLQVILRNFFHSGITWGDVVVRHLVLWVGFIGASIATKEDSHLAMDLISRFLPKGFKQPTAVFVHAASAVVCGFLTMASYHFVMQERADGNLLIPGIEAIPNWYAVIIIPIGFALMSLRFALHILTDVKVLKKGDA